MSEVKKSRLPPRISNHIIDALGGTFEVSHLCGVTPAAVSQWRNNGITRGYALYLRERFKTLPIMQTEVVATY